MCEVRRPSACRCEIPPPLCILHSGLFERNFSFSLPSVERFLSKKSGPQYQYFQDLASRRGASNPFSIIAAFTRGGTPRDPPRPPSQISWGGDLKINRNPLLFCCLLGTIRDDETKLKQKCVKNGIGENFCVRPRFYIVFYCCSHLLVAQKPLKSIVKQRVALFII